MSTAADHLWTLAQTTLQRSVGRGAYELWLSEIRLLCLKGSTVTLEVPTGFHANYIDEHFLGRIETALSVANGEPLSVGRFEIITVQSRMPSQLTYLPQRLAFVLGAARKQELQLTSDAVRYLADRFHTGPQPLHDILLWLANSGVTEDGRLSAKAVQSRLTKPLTWCERTPTAREYVGDTRWLANLLDAVHQPEAHVWLAPKPIRPSAD